MLRRPLSVLVVLAAVCIGSWMFLSRQKNDLSIYTSADWWSLKSSFSILRRMNDVRVPYFITHLPANGSIADLGCGGGLVTEPVGLSGKFALVSGFDINVESLNKAKSHLPETATAVVQYSRGSIYNIPLESSSLDGVIVSDVFEHLNDLPKALREVHRVLKPNGVLVFDTIARTWWSWLSTYFVAQELLGIVEPGAHDWKMFINPEELASLLTDLGFSVDRSEWAGIGSVLSIQNAWKYQSKYFLVESFYKDSNDFSASYLGVATKLS